MKVVVLCLQEDSPPTERELLHPANWTFVGKWQRAFRAAVPEIVTVTHGEGEFVNLGSTFAPPDITSCFSSSASDWLVLTQAIPCPDKATSSKSLQLALAYATHSHHSGAFDVALHSLPSGKMHFHESFHPKAGIRWRQLRRVLDLSRVPPTDSSLQLQWRGKGADEETGESAANEIFVGAKVANISLRYILEGSSGFNDLLELSSVRTTELIHPDKWTFSGDIIVETRLDLPEVIEVPPGAILVNLGGSMAPRSIPYCYTSSHGWGELLQTIPLVHRPVPRLHLTLCHAVRYDQGGQFAVEISSLPSGTVLLHERFARDKGLTWRKLVRIIDTSSMPRHDAILMFKWSGTDSDGCREHCGAKVANISLQVLPHGADCSSDDVELTWY
ncbi:hypothetical protein DYB32_006726 [Aphanomyces invadans]|uniref:Uncharacterized protein n=1 Tax=Aphanomyces invadans TaxID=157072 RepID=A0A418AQW0_9STRA|nr:hypothetical protein DYB32_006726 [Aphanomyces invadans]